MANTNKNANLVEVKLGLARKWERRARATNSRPEQNTLERRAAKYRRQAADLAREK
jgi:hypothetical protein